MWVLLKVSAKRVATSIAQKQFLPKKTFCLNLVYWRRPIYFSIAEEQKLRAKYAQGNRPHGGAGGGHSLFLQKRLAKGQKYFDSGDYQMAKQKSRGPGVPAAAAGRSGVAIPVLAGPPTGDTIPTPDTVPARKSSIIQPIHDASRSMHLPSDPAHLGGGVPIPPAPGQPLPNPAITKLASWKVKKLLQQSNSERDSWSDSLIPSSQHHF